MQLRFAASKTKKSKDQEIQNRLISIKRSEFVKKKEESQLIDERRNLADLAYEQWLESKEFQEFVAEQVESEHNGYGNGEYSTNSFSSENFNIPWLPPSRFVFDKKNLFLSRKRSRTSSAKVRAN
uniref:Uncharacterized protein n=1 Tax=Romanomermis culicivorax TaxID=13658 RepID=A0A915K7M3_ROMCU